MARSDNIADMLTTIRNGYSKRFMSVVLDYSKMKCGVLKVLQDEGYIKGYEVLNNRNIKKIEVYLKYSLKGIPAIHKINRVSKPGKRVYSSIINLKGCYNNMGIYILSTSRGVLSDREAHNQNVGGELICKVF